MEVDEDAIEFAGGDGCGGDDQDGDSGYGVGGDVSGIEHLRGFAGPRLPLVGTGSPLPEGLGDCGVRYDTGEHLLGFGADGRRNGHDARDVDGTVGSDSATVRVRQGLLGSEISRQERDGEDNGREMAAEEACWHIHLIVFTLSFERHNST